MSNNAIFDNCVIQLNNTIESITKHFNKLISDCDRYELIGELLNAIIAYNNSKHLNSCPVEILEKLKLNVHRYKLAIAMYLDDIVSDINKYIEDNNKNVCNLEDMSKEELIAYIKSNENISK